MSMTAGELAARLGGEVRGNLNQVLSRCAAIEEADGSAVTFVANRKYARQLRTTSAAAVIIGAADADRAEHLTAIVCEDPYFAFREAVTILHGFRDEPTAGISELAVVDPAAQIGPGCSISPFVVIEAGATLGAGCVVYPHCYVGRNTVIGENCILYPSVTIYESCTLGDRVVLHAGCVIGEDGFGYATHRGAHHKIPHIGSVLIEDDVEMGAACTVDRGTVTTTRIGKGTKFSNQVTIGHGSVVGEHNLFVGQVGIAGSATTGDYVALGGQVGIVGHICVGDRAQVAAKTGVVSNISPDSKMGGFVAVPLEDAKRIGFEVVHLPGHVKELESLRKRVQQLEDEKAG